MALLYPPGLLFLTMLNKTDKAGFLALSDALKSKQTSLVVGVIGLCLLCIDVSESYFRLEYIVE